MQLIPKEYNSYLMLHRLRHPNSSTRIFTLLASLLFAVINSQAVIVVSNGVDVDVAAERNNVVSDVGTATNRPATDPFVSSTFMTVAPGWTSIQISFLAEDAGFQNDFGWFLYDYDGSNYTILESGLLFDNIEERTQFWQTSPPYVDSGESFILTPEGNDADFYVGWYLTNPNGDTFYTINELNANEEDHFGAAEMTGLVDGYYMGIDDQLFADGDRDYNDVIFHTFSETGLDPNPSVPEPATTALVLALASLLVVRLRKRK